MNSSKQLMAAGFVVVTIIAGVAGIIVTSQTSKSATPPVPRTSVVPHPSEKPESTSDDENDPWKSRLTEMEFQVTRKKGTERAFTGKYWNHKGHGVYRCVCCKTPLFDSNTKFDSGTGWPSFYQPIEETKIDEVTDFSLLGQRTEVVCRNCKAHLGHRFEDAPQQPTGLRYCINSASLDFQETADKPKTGE